MAAPVAAAFTAWGFRDAKGNTVRLRCLVGTATSAGLITQQGNLGPLLQACSNAHVYAITTADAPDRAYGTSAEYNTVEDKAQLTFVGVDGSLHRYQVAAPISGAFLADQETVNPANTAIAALVTFFQTYVYGRAADTSPLTYIGGSRVRRRQHRRLNIFVKDPTLTEPAE